MKSKPWDLGGTDTFSVHNVNSKAGAIVLSNSCRSQKLTANGKLVFYRYGHEYFLAEVWNRNSFVGSQIKINPRQEAEKESKILRGSGCRALVYWNGSREILSRLTAVLNAVYWHKVLLQRFRKPCAKCGWCDGFITQLLQQSSLRRMQNQRVML